MFAVVFVVGLCAAVVALGVTSVVKLAQERREVFRSEEPPAPPLSDQARLEWIRRAQERARREAHHERD